MKIFPSLQNSNILKIVLIKPSKYDDDGYVISHWKGTLPSNTLAAMVGLTDDIKKRKILGKTEIKIEMLDESIQRICPEKIVKSRKKEKILVCLVGVQTNQFPRASDLAKKFKSLNVNVMIGGFHVSGSNEMLGIQPEMQELMDLGITIVCGEVEEQWGNILLDVIKNETKLLYNFVNDKPDLFDKPIPLMPKKYRKHFTFNHMCTIDTSRGCPFNCSFCTIINVQGRKMRYRSPNWIAEKIRENWKHGITHYFFVDDNLARNPAWEQIFDNIIALKKEEIKITFMMQVDLLSHRIKNFVQKAREAGCTQVFLGMESLNLKNLVNSGKNQNKIEDYQTLIKTYRSYEISTHCGYIIGFDEDTYENVIHNDLEKLINDIQPDQASFFMMTPLPGSADHKKWKAENRQMDSDFNRYDSFHDAMEHPLMKREEWFQSYKDAWKKFYTHENMKSILQRASDRNYFNIMKNFIWYKNALIENEHPMITGFFRKKYRLDRRPGFPIEKRWPFFKRRTKEIFSILFEWLKLYWEMQELWLTTWPQRDKRVQIAKKYIVSWKNIFQNFKNPLHWPKIPTQIGMRFTLLGKKKLFGEKHNINFLMKRRSKISRKMLNLYWAQAISKFKNLDWNKIEIEKVFINLWREIKINFWFISHIANSGKLNPRN